MPKVLKSLLSNLKEVRFICSLCVLIVNLVPGSVSLDSIQELACFEFPTGVPVGNGTLKLDFHGHFSDDMLGLYRSTYKDADGSEINILATQFEVISRFFFCLSLFCQLI